MRRWLKERVPPGVDAGREARGILLGLLGAALCNLRFLAAYGQARDLLYQWTGTERILRPGAVLPPIRSLLGWSLYGCFLAAMAMAALAAWHWAYHYRESKSIYLMRRLPDRWEFWRRCFTLPLLGAGACGLEAVALMLVNFAVYRLCTPAGCVPPGQWAALWGL